MRFKDLVTENSELEDAVIDLLAVMAGEGVDSVPIASLVKELSNQGIDVDEDALFDVAQNLAIVRNIKDEVIFFNTDSDASRGDPSQPDPEKQDKKIDGMARKQVKKELDT
jgi:aryl carrier-like protein